MICPNCKTEVPDNALFCPKCGTSMENQTTDYKTPKKKISFSPKGKIAIIIVAIVLVVAIAGGVLYTQAPVRYAIAEKLFEAEQYELSTKLYGTLGKYEDSAKKLALSKKGVNYNNGLDYMASKEYEKAIASFEKANNFEDAPDKIYECYYLLGDQLSENKQAIKAAEAYGKTKQYKDSEDKIIALAESAMASDDYETAANILQNSCKANNQSYGKGYIAFLNKEYESAFDLFSSAGEVYNAKDLYNQSGLMYAQSCMTDGSLDIASSVLSKISSDTKYDNISASSLQEKLDSHADFVSLCGKWAISSGHAKVTQSGNYYTYSWDRDLDPYTYDITVKCVINNDGTVKIKTSGSIFVFTDYSTVSIGLDYEDHSLDTCQNVSAMGTINVDDYTTLTLSSNGVSVSYDCTENNKDVYFTYHYTTQGTYDKRMDY